MWSAVTPFGRAVLVAGLGAWALAWRYDWREAALVSVACLGGVLVGVVFLLMSRSQMAVVSSLLTPRVEVGQTAHAEVEATNNSGRRMLPIRMETRIGARVAPLHVPTLQSGATHHENVPIPTTRRAVLPVGPVRSVLGDPLGLVRRERLWTGSEDLFVHPRYTPLAPFSTGWIRDLEGQTTNDRSPSDVAFHTLREYVIGDDRRHVHWRTTARQSDGKLMVREFVDTRQAHLAIVLSLHAGDYRSEEEFELAVSVAASLGLRAFADDQEVSVFASGRQLPSFHRVSLLDALAGVEVRPDAPDVAAAVGRSRDGLARASVVAIVTGGGAGADRVRSAAARSGGPGSAIGIRADCSGPSALRRTSQVPVVDVADLDDLRRLVWAALNP